MARELAYTARNFDGAEAKAIGLVNRCYATPEELHAGVGELARCIAEWISSWYVAGTSEAAPSVIMRRAPEAWQSGRLHRS